MTVKEQKEWKIPPCISNWKNAKVLENISRNFAFFSYTSISWNGEINETESHLFEGYRNFLLWFQGYTIPLDKRLAADGRGLQQVHINENFAKLAEALYIADRKAREAVEMRAQLEKKLAQKEKEKKEDHLRQLAQKAREERAGLKSATALGSYKQLFTDKINKKDTVRK